MERARIQPPAALPPADTAPLHYEFDAVRKDGETITLRGVTRRIDWDGEPAWQTTVIDVTEQRRAERRLRQRQLELARMTQVSAVAETAGQLAHELNQPLTAIMLYCDSILELAGGPPALPAALAPLLQQQTAAQAQRAGEILNNLRTFLRQRAVDKTWTDLNALTPARRAVPPGGVSLLQGHPKREVGMFQKQPPQTARAWGGRAKVSG